MTVYALSIRGDVGINWTLIPVLGSSQSTGETGLLIDYSNPGWMKLCPQEHKRSILSFAYGVTADWKRLLGILGSGTLGLNCQKERISGDQ